MKKTTIILLFIFSQLALAQVGGFVDDDIELGGDIFSDFSEDITEKEMARTRGFIVMVDFLVLKLVSEVRFLMATEELLTLTTHHQ